VQTITAKKYTETTDKKNTSSAAAS